MNPGVQGVFVYVGEGTRRFGEGEATGDAFVLVVVVEVGEGFAGEVVI